MARALGLQCSVSIAGSTAFGMLRGTGGQLTVAARKIIAGSSANPLQGLIGYAASTGAKSALAIAWKLPYASAASMLNGALAAVGVAVNLGFGSAGGLALTNAFLETLEVTGSEGGDIECSATFQSVSLLGSGSGGTPVSGDRFKFTDVVSCVGPGISTSDVNAFTFRLTRTLAPYRGNSPYGIPKYLSIADTESGLDLEYLKTSEGATTAAVGFPVTTADASVTLAGSPLFNGGPTNGLTLAVLAAFHDPSPTVNGSEEAWQTERSTLKGSVGTFSIS